MSENAHALISNPPALDVQDRSAIRIVFASQIDSPTATIHDFNGSLLISGPAGQRTGENAVTGEVFEEIARSAYYTEAIEDPTMEGAGAAWRIIEIQAPAPGRYVLTIQGTHKGKYDLTLAKHDAKLESLRRSFESIPILPGVAHFYVIEVAESLGSLSSLRGGFDGDGEASPEANQLLSYASMVEGRVSLPPQTTQFALLIVYADNVEAESFRARLNSVDVSDLFSPVPGGWEYVLIPIEVGENTLTMSISGDGPGTTPNLIDADTLVFVVGAR